MNLSVELIHYSWERAWRAVGANESGAAIRDALIARYSETSRSYHSMQHLQECLEFFNTAQHLAARPAEVELALWFHDAIYDTKAKDNEEQSAAWAVDALRSVGVATDAIARVKSLILVTKHTAAPAAQDEMVLVDIDLSILGSVPARFAEYERQIRTEYAFVPGIVFRIKRQEILRSFLNRSNIYNTKHFHDLLERQARINLAKAIGPNAA